MKPQPIPTVKPPQRPDFPEFMHCRGYAREQVLQRLARLAQIQRPRPPFPLPTNMSHSTHTAPAAQALRTLTRAWARRRMPPRLASGI